MFWFARIAKRFFLIVAFGGALLVPASSQKLVEGSQPVVTSLPNFAAAYCSALSEGFRVCRVRTTEDGDASFVVQKSGVEVTRIEAPFWAIAGAEPLDFFAYLGDLDADGSREIVLVSQEGVSNGMGITFSTVYIIDGRMDGSQARPVSFSIEEFGEGENFIYNPRTRRTEILISYWESYDSIDRNRGWGMYLIGKWFRYRHKRLEPIVSRPTLARRFLFSFADERDNGSFENRRPYAWLTDRRAHRLFRQPDDLTKPIRVQYGTVREGIEPNAANEETSRLTILSDDGQILYGTFNAAWDGDKNATSLNIRTFGNWRERYLYPLTRSTIFRPLVFLDRIEGRRVRLETYHPDYGDEFTKVWLLE